MNNTSIQGSPIRLELLVLVAWLLLYLVGMLGAHAQHASLWFPPAALSFAALLVVGWRMALPIGLAIVIVTVWPGLVGDSLYSTSQWILAGLVFSAAHLISYGLAALALRRLGQRADHELALIVIDFLLVAVIGSLLASVLGLLALVATGLMAPSAAPASWLTFWVGDLVALIVLAPWMVAMLLRFTPSPQFRIRPLEDAPTSSGGRFALRLGLNAVVITAAMLLAAGLGTLESAFAIFFLMLPQMWLTFSEPPRRTAISVAVNSAVVVSWLFLLELGPFVFVYQFAVAIVATVAYFGIAIPLLHEDNSRLRRSVMVDRLTGAGSREYLERQADFELKRAERNHAVLCLLVIDVDHFKRVNDARGHVAGDRVLAEASRRIHDVLRPSDVFARFGGDEFVALLPDTEPDIAGDLADRIRQAIRDIETGDGLSVTASIGLAESRPGDRFEQLFERADGALYAAKRAGRDRLRIHTGA
jgi:diguanylate cyclase (GGDEF)-like protein